MRTQVIQIWQQRIFYCFTISFSFLCFWSIIGLFRCLCFAIFFIHGNLFQGFSFLRSERFFGCILNIKDWIENRNKAQDNRKMIYDRLSYGGSSMIIFCSTHYWRWCDEHRTFTLNESKNKMTESEGNIEERQIVNISILIENNNWYTG